MAIEQAFYVMDGDAYPELFGSDGIPIAKESMEKEGPNIKKFIDLSMNYHILTHPALIRLVKEKEIKEPWNSEEAHVTVPYRPELADIWAASYETGYGPFDDIGFVFQQIWFRGADGNDPMSSKGPYPVS